VEKFGYQNALTILTNANHMGHTGKPHLTAEVAEGNAENAEKISKFGERIGVTEAPVNLRVLCG
jgi:hypothetical protein